MYKRWDYPLNPHILSRLFFYMQYFVTPATPLSNRVISSVSRSTQLTSLVNKTLYNFLAPAGTKVGTTTYYVAASCLRTTRTFRDMCVSRQREERCSILVPGLQGVLNCAPVESRFMMYEYCVSHVLFEPLQTVTMCSSLKL